MTRVLRTIAWLAFVTPILLAGYLVGLTIAIGVR